MIIFNNPSTSSWMTALTLTIIFLCLIVSTFLNPTVFLYNKKKTSIAGLLFCIISATDFTICLYWPAFILYYASTIDLDRDEPTCYPEASGPKKPQNCIFPAPSPTNLVTGIVSIFLNSVILMTTPILTIVRFIQIRFPFYDLRRSRVLFVLVFLGVAQFSLWSFAVLSPNKGNFFLVSSFVVVPPDPYGAGYERLKRILMYVNSVPILTAQALSVMASAFTALTLIKRRQQLHQAHSNRTKVRALGALKVMFTNISSLIYAIIFCSPLVLTFAKAYDYGSASENDAWTTFWAVNMLPMLSSVWNPVVFLCFTPKSRSNFLSLLDKIRLHFRVNPNNASAPSQSSPSII